MVACDNSECPIEWVSVFFTRVFEYSKAENFYFISISFLVCSKKKQFHYQCAGLTEDPTGNWFCPDCQAQGFGSTSVCPPEDGPARPMEQQPVPPPPVGQSGPLPETSFVVPSDDPVVGGHADQA
jgi:hypothetical protein